MSKKREIEGHIGHYGDGTGASSLVDEVKECRRIAKRVHAILDAHNVPNSLYEDKASKSQRANIKSLVAHHNKDNDGLIVSYHLNASSAVTSAAIGCEVLYSTQKQLATDLSAAIAAAGDFKNRGAKYRDNLGVLTGTIEPAIILETFFVNSRKDVELYNKNFEAICFAIAQVLAAAIGCDLDKEQPNLTLHFTSATLKESFATRTSSRATHKLLDAAAVKHLGYTSKLKDSKLTDGDLAAISAELAVYYVKKDK